MMNSSEHRGMTGIRPRSKVGLALIAAVVTLSVPQIATAASGYYGQKGVSRHGHSSNSDGGRITNLAIDGKLTPKTGIDLPAQSTMTVSTAAYVINQFATTRSSSPVGGVAIATFTINGSTGTYSFYKFHGAYVMSAGVNLNLRVNGDAGSNYRYTQLYNTDNGAGAGGNTSASAALCRITQDTTVSAGDVVMLDLTVAVSPGNANHLKIYGVVFQDQTAQSSRKAGGPFTCHWSGSAAPTSISFLPDSGTIRGRGRLLGLGQ